MKGMRVFTVSNVSNGSVYINGVFSSRENALLFTDNCGGHIEEWTIDSGLEVFSEGKTVYHVTLSKEAEVKKVIKCEADGYNVRLAMTGEITFLYGGDTDVYCFAPCEAEAKEVALKLRRKELRRLAEIC